MPTITVKDGLGSNQIAALVPTTGNAAPANSLPVVQSDDVTVTGPAAQSVLNADLLTGVTNGWYDCGAFQSGSVQIIASAGISAGAVIFEQTNDTTLAPAGVPQRAYEASVIAVNPNIAAITIAASTNRIFNVPINARYIRVRISTAFVGGTVQAVGVFSQRSTNFGVVNVQQSTAANLLMTATAAGTAAAGATASGNPVYTAGVAATAQPTARTAGQMVSGFFSKVGHTVSILNQIRELRDTQAMVTLTNTTETTIAPAVAATFNDLEGLNVCTTATFSGSPTAVRVDFRETTGGAVRFSQTIPLTPGSDIAPICFPAPIKQAVVNTNWTAQVAFVGGTSPAITAGDIRITAQTVRSI
jgi:hypothetical protein